MSQFITQAIRVEFYVQQLVESWQAPNFMAASELYLANPSS